MNRFFAGLTCLALGFAPLAASAHEWVLDGDNSVVYFGSIKKGTVGETHEFGGVSGMVDHDGNVGIDIDLLSVETWIDIRNERLVEFVFKKMASASLSTKVDMDKLEGLEVGGIMALNAATKMTLMGTEVSFDAPMIAARLSETRVLLVSDGMIYLSTEDLGIDAGIDKMTELASLSGITRSVAVSVRFVFDAKK